MESNIQAIAYSEPGEGQFVFCILDPSIDGEKYVKSLNDDIPLYNKDIEDFSEKLKEVRAKHENLISFTRPEYLNEREPKYPKELPKGCKDLAVAYPEISQERERRRKVNKENMIKYNNYCTQLDENIKEEMKPITELLLAKWSKFKSFIGSVDSNRYSFDMTIYYQFYLTKFSYVSNETK